MAPECKATNGLAEKIAEKSKEPYVSVIMQQSTAFLENRVLTEFRGSVHRFQLNSNKLRN